MICICAESRRIARLLTARFEEHFAGIGLSAAHYELLSTISRLQDTNGRQLARHLLIDPTTLSRNLKALHKRGAIRTERSEKDARQIVYRLSTEGIDLLNRARELWQKSHAKTIGELGSKSTQIQQALDELSSILRLQAERRAFPNVQPI